MTKFNKSILHIPIIILLFIFLGGCNKTIRHNVIFDSLGGTIVEAQKIEDGKLILIPEEPTKQGFNFISWQIGDKEYDFNTPVTKDITLLALYEVKDNTEIVLVTLDYQNGQTANIIEIEKNGLLFKSPDPTKDGYEFNGWFLNEKEFDFPKKIEENITLMASWKEVKTTTGSNTNNNNSGNIINGENSFNNSSSPNITIENNNNQDSSIHNEPCKYLAKDATENPGYFNDIGLGEKTQVNLNFALWEYSASCGVSYSSVNSSIAEVDSSGLITGRQLGETTINVCLIEKKTNKKLECFEYGTRISYHHATERANRDANNLIKAVDGYYWYLDGYKYAYLKPNLIPWYDHESLTWDSKYMDLINNRLVTSEDTGKPYYGSSNIHNKFLVNPATFAYSLIEDYGMRISNNKMYMSLGGINYSFTKSLVEKPLDKKIILSTRNVTISEGENFTIDVSLTPGFADFSIEAIPSNGSVADCYDRTDIKKGKLKFMCKGYSNGNTVISIRDTMSNLRSHLNVKVDEVIHNVTGVSLNTNNMSLISGESGSLVSTVSPSNANNKNVVWSSSNNSVATVTNTGKVTAISKGSATISVKTLDGGYNAKCEVTVTNPPLTARGSIGIKTTVSSLGSARGIVAEVKASGGTGTYTYYYIKLYKDGTLIGSTTNTSSNEIFITGYTNGNYTMEYEVRDSDGNTKTGTSSSTISGF